MSLVGATVFAGDETQDVTKLDDLLVKVKKVFPQGWAASIELSDDMRPSRRGPFPTLIIKSIERLPVEHYYQFFIGLIVRFSPIRCGFEPTCCQDLSTAGDC